MAFLTKPPFFLHQSSLFLPTPLFISSPPPLSLPLKKNTNTKIQAQLTNNNNGGAAIVWFKHDLRLDDHPGIVAASNHSIVVPLYVLDPRILSRFSDEMVELVLLAIEDLRRSLKENGSNLMIRFGNVEKILWELVKEVKATVLFAEEEVEYELRSLITIVEKSLVENPALDWNPKIELWRTSLYDVKNLDDLPTFFREVKKPHHNDISLLDIPSLPCCHMGLDWGHLPTIDDVGKFMDSQANREKEVEQWYSVAHTSAEAALRIDHVRLFNSNNSELGQSELFELESSSENSTVTQRKRVENSVFGTRKGNIVSGGTNVVLNALAGYLRYLEGTARADWQEIHRRLRETEIRSGASFGAFFGSALQLGIISCRRVYYEAIKYEKERNGGFLSPFGYSTTVGAAIDTVCSIEWYRLMSLKSQSLKTEQYSKRTWRWNGHLIQYTVVGYQGPAVLLVHGFGAFLEHYRDNLSSIADGGNRVWSLTLLGFGNSEKPNIVYSELMWAELLRDFIIEVVGEPAHVVGNSIGGYFISIVGGLWPSLVKSIILMNTAGYVIPGYSSLLFSKERQISGAAWLGSRALLQYLRLSIKSFVKNCYPSRPERADDWLISEMLRASYDPGSVELLESVFSFNLSIPLNHLLSKLKGKILIIQGMRDPIANSGSKLAMFREHCEGIIIKELDAGHCPHDECPEEVNLAIREWILMIENRSYIESFDLSVGSSCT